MNRYQVLLLKTLVSMPSLTTDMSIGPAFDPRGPFGGGFTVIR